MAEIIEPIHNRAAVRIIEHKEKKVGGLIVMDAGRGDHILEGEVIAVGPGRVSEYGIPVPCPMNVGDIVLLDDRIGNEVIVNGDRIRVLEAHSAIAIIRKG